MIVDRPCNSTTSDIDDSNVDRMTVLLAGKQKSTCPRLDLRRLATIYASTVLLASCRLPNSVQSVASGCRWPNALGRRDRPRARNVLAKLSASPSLHQFHRWSRAASHARGWNGNASPAINWMEQALFSGMDGHVCNSDGSKLCTPSAGSRRGRRRQRYLAK